MLLVVTSNSQLEKLTQAQFPTMRQKLHQSLLSNAQLVTVKVESDHSLWTAI